MKVVKGTKTEKNLMRAFTGESQARNRYTYFASVAEKNGYVQIANIFLETANNEKEHAKIYFKYLQEGSVEFDGTFLTGLQNDTLTNLESAIKGEYEEWSDLYPRYADVAEEEGFLEIATSFRKISEVEKHHEARYKKLRDNILTGKVFEKDLLVDWKCLNCGYVYSDYEAPEACPSCFHPQAYFEILCDNF